MVACLHKEKCVKVTVEREAIGCDGFGKTNGAFWEQRENGSRSRELKKKML